MANRRWLKIGGGIAAGTTTVIGLFILFSLTYNFQITDLTGNIICEGTYKNPCISEFKVKNPSSFNVDIYSKDHIKLEFSPEIEDYALFVVDERCSAEGKCACQLKNNQTTGFNGWRCVDFTNATKPRQDAEYVFRFPAYSTIKFRLVGIKRFPDENIKWTFDSSKGELDPIWLGEKPLDGGGVIIPTYHSFRVIKEPDEIDAHIKNDKLIISNRDGFNLPEKLILQEGFRESDALKNGTRKEIFRDSDKFEINLNKRVRVYFFAENITVIGDANQACGEYCETYFDIHAPKDGISFEVYLQGKARKGVYFNNSGDWEPVYNTSNFTFKVGQTYNFWFVVGKKAQDNVKWGVRAFNEELDPELYGNSPILLVYGDSSSNTPIYRNGTYAGSWSNEGTALDIGDDTAWVKLLQHPFEQEKAMLIQDAANDLHVMFWNGVGWSDHIELDDDYYDSDRGFADLAYMEQSGNLLVAWSRAGIANDDWVWYDVYDGTSWSGVNQLSDDLGNQVENIVLRTRPGTNEIMMLAEESADVLYAYYWNGNSFGSQTILTSDLEDGSTGDPTSTSAERTFDFAWLEDGSTGVAYWGEEGYRLISRTFSTSGGWAGSPVIQDGASTPDVQFIELTSSNWENKIRGWAYDDDNDLWIFEINSTLGLANYTEITDNSFANEPPFAAAVAMPNTGRFIYFFSISGNGHYINDSYNSANIVQYTAKNIETNFADWDRTGNGMVAASVLGESDADALVWNSTSGQLTYTQNLETLTEEGWSADVEINQYSPLPPFNPNVTTCMELNTANKVYLIQNNIQDLEGDCIIITANNVTLNGQGHVINFSLLGSGEPFDIIGGIRIQNHNAFIKNVTVTTYDTELSGNAVGIWVDSYGAGFTVQNVTIQNANVDGGDNLAVLFDIEGKNHKIINSYATNPDQFVLIEYLSSNVLWENITYDVGTGGSFGAVSFYESNDSIVRNMWSNDNLAILHFAEGDNVKNATIINSNFNSGSVNLESGTDYIFINTTYGEETVNGGNLTRKWYYGFQINDSNTLQGISSVSWTLNDTNSQIVSGTTDANGYQLLFPVISYTNRSGVTNNKNPFTVQATKTGYVTNITSFTLNTNVFLQLWTATVPNVSGVLNLPQFQFGICSPDFENATAQPLGQTPTVGTINLTNIGGSTGTARIKYTGALNTGWTLYAANSSQTQIKLNASLQNLISLNPTQTQMIWMYANCSYVHANPGVNIDFDII